MPLTGGETFSNSVRAFYIYAMVEFDQGDDSRHYNCEGIASNMGQFSIRGFTLFRPTDHFSALTFCTLCTAQFNVLFLFYERSERNLLASS